MDKQTITVDITDETYEARAARCKVEGHRLKLWRVRARGNLWTRFLCLGCGRTFTTAPGNKTRRG